MTKQAETFFDDIIKALEVRGESAKFANLSQETTQEFFTDNLKQPAAQPSVPTSVAAPQQAPAPVQNVPGMTFPSVTPTIPQGGQQGVQAPVINSQAAVQNVPISNAPVQPNPSVQPIAAPPQQAPQASPIPVPAPQVASVPHQQPLVQDPQTASSPELSQMDMQTLHGTVNQCSRCVLHKGRKNVVFGTGNPQADLMFIGEAPGRDEDIQGIPFVGEAGQLLTKMINAMQFQRSDVYITSIIKCRPPNNRNPEDLEAETCLPYLKRQIKLLNPKVIVVLGAVPLKYLLGKTGITKRRGTWDSFEGIQVMPTFHPDYLLRNASAKKQVWEDLQKVMLVFGRSYSPVQKR